MIYTVQHVLENMMWILASFKYIIDYGTSHLQKVNQEAIPELKCLCILFEFDMCANVRPGPS